MAEQAAKRAEAAKLTSTMESFWGVDESGKCADCGAADAPHTVGWDAVQNAPIFRLCSKCKTARDEREAAIVAERQARFERDLWFSQNEQ